MLDIKQFVFNPFGESTYVVSDEVSREAIVVDPGMTSAAEERRLDEYIAAKGLKVTAVVNTHMHLDHSFGVDYVRRRYGVPLRAHAADAALAATVGEQARRFGMLDRCDDSLEIDSPLADGDIIRLGDEQLQVLHVPGHSPGGIALYSREGKFVLSGDSLFQGSIGRTDLPGGDYSWIMRSILDKLLPLGDDIRVLPGHGEETTIGHETLYNPFVTEVLNNEVDCRQ